MNNEDKKEEYVFFPNISEEELCLLFEEADKIAQTAAADTLTALKQSTDEGIKQNVEEPKDTN